MGEAPLYPVSLVLEGLPCLVVGGGPVALRKVRGLVECRARVTVIAPEVVEGIDILGISVERRCYRSGDVGGFRLVIAATGDRQVNRMVYGDAEAAGIFVNSADDPDACSVMLPSVVRHDPVTVAVSTGGASPALAVWLRRLLGGFVGPEHGELAALVGEARHALHAAGRSSESVRWQEVFDGEVLSLIREGRSAEARRRVAEVAGVALQPVR